MAFLTLDGIPIPVFRDSLRETTKDVGDEPLEGVTGVMMATRVAVLRRWSFNTGALAPDEWVAFRALIDGFGASWRFTSASKISDQGFTNTIAGTFTPSGAGGKHVGSVAVGSGSHFTSLMRYRMGVQAADGWQPANGYTFFGWRNFVAGETYAAGFKHFLVTGQQDFVRGASANPFAVNQYVTGALDNAANLGRVLSVSSTSPYVGVHGYKTDNTAAAITYSDLVFLPFRLPNITTALGSNGLTEAAWASAIYTAHNAAQWDKLPRHKLSGDCMEGVPTYVIARVRGSKQLYAKKSGASAADANYRDLDVDLFETLDAA